jgi:hypothetical protein
MKSVMTKATLVSLALGAAMFALSGTANASHVTAEVVTPSQVTLGDSLNVQLSLLSADEGLPLAGVPVTFHTDAAFGGVSGEVEVGRTVTDENGVAVLGYVPRHGSDHQIRAEYLVPGSSERESAITTFTVEGATQLHQSTAGVQIPGLNVWLLIALVSSVWAILMSVALRVIAIARAGSYADAAVEASARLELP